jgi:hypothetical protein
MNEVNYFLCIFMYFYSILSSIYLWFMNSVIRKFIFYLNCKLFLLLFIILILHSIYNIMILWYYDYDIMRLWEVYKF